MKTSAISTSPDSADAFRPLVISRNTTGSTIDSISVSAAGRWAIRFAANKGGGLKFLARNFASTNQLDTNLFTILYNGASCDAATGTLSLVDSDVVHARITQQVTISSQPFTVDYNVLGSGKLYARVSTYAASNLSAAPLEFRIAHNHAGSAHIDTVLYGTTPATCSGFLHVDSTSVASGGAYDGYDILCAPFVPWAQANATTSSNKFMGLKCTSWSLAAMSRQTWEFMLDFSHTALHDSTRALAYVNDYSNPDSLYFYTGTRLLEKAWENQLVGHWKLDEVGGDTAADNSTSSNSGRIRGPGNTGLWTNGEWGGGDSLRATDSIIAPPSSSYFGNTGGFTILGWIKPASSLTTSSVILKKYSATGPNGYELTGAAGGQLQFTISKAGVTHTLTGKTVIATGQWYHVGAQLSWAADTMKIYVNGVIDTMLVGTLGYPGATSTTVDSVSMGNSFNGVVDDMRFYGSQIWDNQVKAIYLRGFTPDVGKYSLRADNNSTIQTNLNGLGYNRYLPAFKITNYWGSGSNANVPQYVYVNGAQLSNTNGDYIAGTDQGQRILTIGFNRVITANSTIYISGTGSSTVNLTNAMPRMYWGTSGTNHFYVKNFAGDYLGSSTANQFYIDWSMGTFSTSTGKCGEIYRLKTSKYTPNAKVDTTSTGDLCPTDSTSWGDQWLYIGGKPLLSSSATSSPTYTVAESSAVRVVLRLSNRTLSNTSTCGLATQWTIYPTGQIFRWDSLFSPSGNIDTARADFFMKDTTSGTAYTLGTGTTGTGSERGGLYGSNIQDFAVSFLSYNNTVSSAPVLVAHPYNGLSDTAKWMYYPTTANVTATSNGVRFEGGKAGLWATGNAPYQAAYYQDISKPSIVGSPASKGIDSVCKGVTLFRSGTLLAMTSGTLVHGASALGAGWSGDVDTDGFNDREGAYVIDDAGYSNAVKFTLNAAMASPNVDTCRRYPAFRINNYYAATVPPYVYVNSVLKTSGYDYNAYLNRATEQLVIQFNQIFCGDSVIYISYSTTLAVTMTDFNAVGGDRNDTLQWRTESEEQNLGFYVYKRIKPSFLDSLVSRSAAAGDTLVADNAALCLRKKLISAADTSWMQLNKEIVHGAAGGVSTGPKNYKLMDYDVNNDVAYEYKLVSVDFNNVQSAYGKYAEARPSRILPSTFDLRPNYPNPFRTLTTIRYSIPIKTRVDISVYSLQGRLIRRILNAQKLEPGFYKAIWDGKDDFGRSVASGPYVYRLLSPQTVKTHIMILAR
jgi:hypothetical protein